MNASNSRPAGGRGARGRGRKWWMWGNQFYFCFFFLPWAPANVCIFRWAGGGEVATEGGKDGGKGDELQAFPCFFFFLWWGDRKRAAQGQQLSSQHAANRVEGGKWDFQVRGSDVASSLFVFPLEPCSLFYFFMSLQTKPANQTCPDMASPGFYRWFPVSRGGAAHSHHSLTQLFYSKETSSNPHHFLCACSVSLFRKVPDGLFKCLRYRYGNQYPPSILAWVCRDWRQLESVRGAASSFSYYQRLAG